MHVTVKTHSIRRGRHVAGIVIAAAALSAIALAGCSSGSSSSPGGTGSASGSAGSSPSGTPYVFGTDSTDSSQSLSLVGAADGFMAWANYTNAHGGILGHPVKVIRCNDENTPDGNTACARQLIQNQQVLAVAGSESGVLSASGEPLLSAAGLPYVCGNPLAPPEFQGSSAFCVTGGPAAEYAALVDYLVGTMHIKNIVSVNIGTTVGMQTTAFWSAIAKQEGATVEDVVVQPAQADYTPAVTQAQAYHAGAYLIGIDPASTARFFQAAVQAGVTVPMATVGSAVTQAVTQAAGQYGGPFYYTQSAQILDESNPQIAAYLSQMKADGYEAQVGNASVASWMTGLVLQNAITKLGEGNVSRTSLQQLLQHGSLTNVPLLPSPLTLTGAPATFPHLANAGTYIVKQQGSSSSYVGDRVTAHFFGG
jgi:ABC-type branched-subunit amino acid transport system substrate-binding protein